MFRLRRNRNLSALELLAKHEEMLAGACLAHAHELTAVSRTLADKWEEIIIDETDFIISVGRGREALRQTIFDMKKTKQRSSEATERIHYQISSLFLRDSWLYLKSDPRHNERLHLVTGTITADGTRVLSRMEQVKYAKQSGAYVSVEKSDSHQKMVSLAEDYGHLVLAVFHSHMSQGLSATAPSSIDQAFLARMNEIGCDCLGGIFSLDGYARFFAAKTFEIEVYGNGAQKVLENSSHKIFKIMEVSDRARKDVPDKAGREEGAGQAQLQSGKDLRF
jgi:hypothetical protein